MPDKKNIYAAILVGGTGTRFWPMSRAKMPKQFLDVTGSGTLFEETLNRIKPKILPKNIYIVTNLKYKTEVEKNVRKFKIPSKNILLEPKAKNTAPAVCWAAFSIHKINPNAIMLVLPSDHLILNRQKYYSVLDKALKLAEGNHLVTLGIVPTRPDIGYGYLKTAKRKIGSKSFIKVEKFTEKPSLIKARQFSRRKNYYWNSGMFVWKTSVILEQFKEHLPDMYESLKKSSSQKNIAKAWEEIQSISIDYGILEKSEDVVAVPAKDIKWSDLGSWESLVDVLAKDKKGSILKGDVTEMHCRNMLAWSTSRPIISIGVKDIIIIDMPDALLVCKTDESQRVKEVVEILNKKKRYEIL